ncbi:hypothetical protein C8F01DRAFT_1090652 [Mycena amicta]|nr:hypothetical protein C8F01DRAFT_1090652 [Mycena amicta]
MAPKPVSSLLSTSSSIDYPSYPIYLPRGLACETVAAQGYLRGFGLHGLGWATVGTASSRGLRWRRSRADPITSDGAAGAPRGACPTSAVRSKLGTVAEGTSAPSRWRRSRRDAIVSDGAADAGGEERAHRLGWGAVGIAPSRRSRWYPNRRDAIRCDGAADEGRAKPRRGLACEIMSDPKPAVQDADAGQTGALQAKPGAQQAKPTLKQAKPDAQQAKPELGPRRRPNQRSAGQTKAQTGQTGCLAGQTKGLKQAKPDAQQAKPELGLACYIMTQTQAKPALRRPNAGQTGAPQAKPAVYEPNAGQTKSSAVRTTGQT